LGFALPLKKAAGERLAIRLTVAGSPVMSDEGTF
jgi:hypothetical protein